MEDNSLLMIILALIFGIHVSGMMKQMCGRQRLVEGLDWDGLGCTCTFDEHCQRGLTCGGDDKCVEDYDYDPWDGGVGGWYDRKMEDATRKGRNSGRDCLSTNSNWGMD